MGAITVGNPNMIDIYQSVPKGFSENLKFRKKLVRVTGKSARKDLWIACSRSLLFYINTFVWTLDPRLKNNVVPFITYPFQDECLLKILECVHDGKDMCIKKSRDMGASWMCVMAFEWLWHFKAHSTFLLMSQKETKVDKKGDPKTLFYKIDFLLKKQPKWLRPRTERTKLHLLNEDNESTIDGESTTGSSGRGDRRTAILLDEFSEMKDGHLVLSATADVTNCRLINSTPPETGKSQAWIDIQKMEGVEQLRLHWSLHPVKAAGLTFDKKFKKPSSPWYEKEVKRRHPREIARELDMDDESATYQFFEPKYLDEYEREFSKPPMWIGDLLFGEDLRESKFEKHRKGSISLWETPDNPSRFEQDDNNREFCMGIDISFGTGSSNSTITVGCKKTGKQVMEYANPNIAPHDFARLAAAVGYWFRSKGDVQAYMIWEHNGPGMVFGKTLVEELGYFNFFYRRNEITLSKKIADIPGWHNNRQTGRILLMNYSEAILNKKIQILSKDSLDEAREYIYTINGNIVYSPSVRTKDPTGSRESHGDRVISAALCWMGMSLLDSPREVKTENHGNSYGSRRKRRRDRDRLLSQDYY